MIRRFGIPILVLALLTATPAFAGLGGTPVNLGFGARGLALGTAYTALIDDASTAFYNPAAMAAMPNSDLAFTYIYAQPEFTGGPKDNTFNYDSPNRVVEFNLAQKLNDLLKSSHDIAFGFNVALDDNGLAFIRFYDVQNGDGFYYFYGESGFTLNFTVGFATTDWLYLGGGVTTTLHSKSDFTMQTDLAGNTSREGNELEAEVVFAPVGALLLRFAPVDIGLTFHGATWGQFSPITVAATATVGDSELASLPMQLYFKDNYTPHRLGLGAFWKVTDWMNFTADAVYYNWSAFVDEVEIDDLPRNGIKIEFRDILDPHAGFEFFPIPALALRAGYGFHSSPVTIPGSSENMILDNDKHLISAGAGYTVDNPPLLKMPLSFDATYFLHYLVPRDLTSSDGKEYESSGMMNGVAATLTLRY